MKKENLKSQPLSSLTMVVAVVYFVSMAFLAVTEFATGLQTIKNNPIVSIIVRTVFVVTTTYMAFQKLSDTDRFVKTVSVVGAALIFVQAFVPQQIDVVLMVVSLPIISVVALLTYYNKEQYTFLLYAQAVIHIAGSVRMLLDFSFEANEWVFALVGGIAAVIVAVAFGVCACLRLFKKDKKQTITILAFATILTFVFVWFAGANTNYAFDTSIPTEIAATVTEKDVSAKKFADTYRLYFEYNNEKHCVEVRKDDYESFEIGDSLSVKRYNGAYGVAYYLPVLE